MPVDCDGSGGADFSRYRSSVSISKSGFWPPKIGPRPLRSKLSISMVSAITYSSLCTSATELNVSLDGIVLLSEHEARIRLATSTKIGWRYNVKRSTIFGLRKIKAFDSIKQRT